MDAILAFFGIPLFTLLHEQVTVLETFGFVTGALCVWAVSRQWLWNWPVGLLNNLAFFALFATSGLYADAGLQVAFFLLGGYGWIAWIRRRRIGAAVATSIPVRRARAVEIVVGIALTAVGTVAIAFLLATETDSVVPWPDAFIASASLVATWGQARKIIEQWVWWIVVDVVSVPLYLIKGLSLTAILYTGFLALCIYGLVSWRRELRAQRVAPSLAAEPARVDA
jgi:nicotinamide mononucleotide transporter